MASESTTRNAPEPGSESPEPAGGVPAADVQRAAPASGGGFVAFALTAVLVLAAAVVFSSLMRQGGGQDRGGLEAGKPLPAIEATGWVNSETGVSNADLQGSVVVVHGWFVGCPYCWQEAPELVELHQKYSGDGVKFLGLTHEEGEVLPDIHKFVEQNEISWPQAYGARNTLIALGAEYFPIVWVIDREGRIVWNRDAGGTLDEAIQAALAS